MKKILIVITTSFCEYGGLSNAIMNYYKFLDRKEFMIDFASTNIPNKEDKFYKYIKINKSNYYCLGNRKKNIFSYLRNLKKILKNGNYDVIHVNGNSATIIFELIIAKNCNVKSIIAHGHTTRSNHPFIHMILKKFIKGYCTTAIAVSEKAGKWLYGRDYVVLNNAIDLEKYEFNEGVRDKVRHNLNINDEIVYGHVGKLYYPKNQKFIIEIFERIYYLNRNVKLLFVGSGYLEDELKQIVKKKKLDKNVIFLGMCNNVEEIVQAFDVFIFPSIYEGLGLALIEAQAAGLKCIASTNVPLETCVTKNVKFLELDKGANEWADEIINIKLNDRNIERDSIKKSIIKSGYSIKEEAIKLKDIYLKDGEKLL